MTRPTIIRRGAAGHSFRRYVPGLALALTLTTVGAGTVMAAAPTPAPTAATRADSTQRLHFAVEFSPFQVIDLPPKDELQPGDYSVFSDRLLNRAGRVVGVQGGSGLVTKVRATGAQVYFTLAVRLPHGQIAAAGLSSTAATKRLAVVGGTGRYSGAAGHAVLVENGDDTGTLTIILRRSSE